MDGDGDGKETVRVAYGGVDFADGRLEVKLLRAEVLNAAHHVGQALRRAVNRASRIASSKRKRFIFILVIRRWHWQVS